MRFIHSRRALKIGSALLSAVLLMAIGVCFMFVGPSVSQFLPKSSFFTVVLDCGSTGTRVNVYEWMVNGGTRKGDLPILVHTYPDNSTENQGGCQYHCMQTKPGLDKFVGNASGVRASLEPLIRRAEKWVPSERHGDTPLFVLATAGLRRLQMDDARQILDDIADVLKEHKFKHRKSWIRVLSGKEEAFYGWVALNYQMGIFANSSRLPTLGLLDLGGSSLQVVSEMDGLQEDDHVLRSKIGSVEYKLKAYSLPAFGFNEAFYRTVVMLSHTQAIRESTSGSFEVRHPCISSSFVQNYTCHGCFRSHSSNSENSSGPIRENELSSLYLVGEANWNRCKALARAAACNSSIIDWSQLAGHSNCTGTQILNLTRRTSSKAHFHALSGFFVVYNMLNLSPRANLTRIWVKGQESCSQSWADMIRKPGNPNNTGQHCFRVLYLASLIEYAQCLGNAEIIFGPGDISWTLGAALIEGGYLWFSGTKSQSGILNLKNRGVISSPMFAFVFLLCLLFIVYCCQIKLPMPSRKIATARAYLPSHTGSKWQPV